MQQFVSGDLLCSGVRDSMSTHKCLIVTVVAYASALSVGPTLAENIDPTASDAQYAWTENTGWLNAESLGDGGSGIQVDDFELSGWMWGENIGWLSLNCTNTASCATADFRVNNNGNGMLSGFAWGENVGWVNFGPITGGVSIDTTTGLFSGTAWGENIGWVNFSFADLAIQPFQIETSWSCNPPPLPPADEPVVIFTLLGNDTFLGVTPVADATGQDVVYGDTGVLLSTAGDFGASTIGCYKENDTSNLMLSTAEPPLGEIWWYLARGANCGGSGSYGTADAAITGSGKDCEQ